MNPSPIRKLNGEYTRRLSVRKGDSGDERSNAGRTPMIPRPRNTVPAPSPARTNTPFWMTDGNGREKYPPSQAARTAAANRQSATMKQENADGILVIPRRPTTARASACSFAHGKLLPNAHSRCRQPRTNNTATRIGEMNDAIMRTLLRQCGAVKCAAHLPFPPSFNSQTRD